MVELRLNDRCVAYETVGDRRLLIFRCRWRKSGRSPCLLTRGVSRLADYLLLQRNSSSLTLKPPFIRSTGRRMTASIDAMSRRRRIRAAGPPVLGLHGRKGVCDPRRIGAWKPVSISVNSYSGRQRTPSKNRHQSPLAPAHLSRLNGETAHLAG